MISRQAARDAIQRFSGLAGFGNLPDIAVKELISTMASVAQTGDHADRIVSEILREVKFAPTPSEITFTANATAEKRPRPRCDCEQGFVRCTMLATDGTKWPAVRFCPKCRPQVA